MRFIKYYKEILRRQYLLKSLLEEGDILNYPNNYMILSHGFNPDIIDFSNLDYIVRDHSVFWYKEQGLVNLKSIISYEDLIKCRNGKEYIVSMRSCISAISKDEKYKISFYDYNPDLTAVGSTSEDIMMIKNKDGRIKWQR